VKVGLPRAGAWRVALDTSGFDEFGTASQADRVIEAEEVPWHGQPYSVDVRLAALSGLFLVPAEQQEVPVELPLAEGIPDESRSGAPDLEADEARRPG